MISRGIILSCVAVLGGWIGFMMTDREVPIIVKSKEVVLQDTPSRLVQFQYNAFRKKICPTEVSRLFKDVNGVRFPLTTLHYPEGSLPLGEDSYRTQMLVPDGVFPGEGTYTSIACYFCNPLAYIIPVCSPPRDLKVNITREMLETK